MDIFRFVYRARFPSQDLPIIHLQSHIIFFSPSSSSTISRKTFKDCMLPLMIHDAILKGASCNQLYLSLPLVSSKRTHLQISDAVLMNVGALLRVHSTSTCCPTSGGAKLNRGNSTNTSVHSFMLLYLKCSQPQNLWQQFYLSPLS